MGGFRTILLFVVSVSINALASFSDQAKPEIALSNAQKEAFKSSDAFLRRLGYEDYAGQAQKMLDSGKKIHPVSKYALELNVDNFESLNGSRKIGNFVFAVLKSAKEQGPQVLDKKISLITQVLVQQLQHFPQLRFEPVDIGATAGKTLDELLDVRIAILAKRTNERFFIEKLNLIKALQSLWPRLEASESKTLTMWLDDVLSDAIWDSYNLYTLQQNRLLGRAIILSLVKFLRENKMASTENQLALDLRKENLFIENYVHGQFMTMDRDYKYRVHKFKSGDVAFEYSHGREAFFTSLVVRPQKPENVAIAEKYKLNNSYRDFTLFLSTEEFYKSVDKKSVGLPFNFFEQRVYNQFWDTEYTNGFSHCGLVELRTDKETGISTAWIWDTFPETESGGSARLLTPEGFSISEKHLKIGFLRYDPKKVLKLFKEQIKTRGYLKEIWHGHESDVVELVGGKWGPIVNDSGKYTWESKVDKATVLSWLSVEDSEAEDWYQNTILPRVFDRVHSYVSSEEAVVFAAGLVNSRSMLYCSQVVVISFLEAANIDLQDEKDVLPSYTKILGDSLKKIVNLSENQRLIAPNGLIWQSKIFESLETIYHNRDRSKTHGFKDGKTLAERYTRSLESVSEVKATTLSVEEDELLRINSKTVILDYED